MNDHDIAHRREFLQRTASLAALGGAAFVASHGGNPIIASEPVASSASPARRLPREVAIATISQEGLRGSSPTQMISRILARMSEAVRVQPDIICLPEVFAFANLDGGRPAVADVAEEGIGEVLAPFAKFAADHHCHVVCATYTRSGDHCFNSAVFLNRQGEIVGEYRKAFPTVGEMQNGVMPGPLEIPVIETDLGKLGAQICFDIEWDHGWRALQNGGAEIVFWPSAFAGGRKVNARAWQHRYCVVSSTRKDSSKICDVTGEELATTSRWHPWAWGTVNLEKAFLHTWPYVTRFGDLISRYGNRIRITTHALEEWSVIESRDPDLKMADLMSEFELVTLDDHLKLAERMQDRLRVS